MKLQGVLIVNKPPGLTSHDVVDRVRRAARMRRVGHTGTLDPIATGVLPLCLGQATKIAQFLLAEVMALGLVSLARPLEFLPPERALSRLDRPLLVGVVALTLAGFWPSPMRDVALGPVQRGGLSRVPDPRSQNFGLARGGGRG